MQYAKEIYDLCVKYRYSVADNRMLSCGQPGIPGPSSDGEKWDEKKALLDGTIRSLEEIRSKLHNGI